MEVNADGLPLAGRDKKLWEPIRHCHDQSLLCLKEIKSELTPTEADQWSQDCRAYANQLSANRLALARGMEIVCEWIGQLRRYLRAMGRVDLLPPPEGSYPTPTSSASPVADDSRLRAFMEQMDRSAKDFDKLKDVVLRALDELTVDEIKLLAAAPCIAPQIDTLRWAITQTEPSATPRRLQNQIKADNMNRGGQKRPNNRQRVYLALHVLTCLGEYSGLAQSDAAEAGKADTS